MPLPLPLFLKLSSVRNGTTHSRLPSGVWHKAFKASEAPWHFPR